MSLRLVVLGIAMVASLGGAASALTPGEHARARGFREGANHHLGDDSFLARFGRAPDGGDSEAVRMHTHLVYVHAWLAARPATAPALAPRRRELLGHLERYIAKGETPVNLHRPWRSPVFIDDDGNICAVGYLIEQSAGRAMAERIAASHRYDLLEDIALPELAAWVAGSGFTLEELASIQPGYQGPEVELFQLWTLKEARPADGPWQLDVEGVVTAGSWKRGQMEGHWTRTAADGVLLGEGDLRGGRGNWKSYGAGGKLLAEGRFSASHPDGAWRFFHPSGRLAAEGPFQAGNRHGAWRFFHDDAAHALQASGRFTRGALNGKWRHFDHSGARFAEAWTDTPRAWAGNVAFMLRLEPGAAGITREVHQGTIAGDWSRIDRVTVDGQPFVFHWLGEGDPEMFDAAGHALDGSVEGWVSRGCGWGAALTKAARAGSLARVHVELQPGYVPAAGCEATTLDAAQSRRVERALAAVRALAPDLPGEPMAETAVTLPTDPARVLASNMSWYIEWPQIDGLFEQVLPSLPDHYKPMQFDDELANTGGLVIR